MTADEITEEDIERWVNVIRGRDVLDLAGGARRAYWHIFGDWVDRDSQLGMFLDYFAMRIERHVHGVAGRALGMTSWQVAYTLDEWEEGRRRAPVKSLEQLRALVPQDE